MNSDFCGQLAALVMLILLFSLTQRKSGQKVPAQVSPQPWGAERTLRKVYGPKIAEWKRRSLAGYAKSIDKKWENWLEEMAK
jgi:hypothetical protein